MAVTKRCPVCGLPYINFCRSCAELAKRDRIIGLLSDFGATESAVLEVLAKEAVGGPETDPETGELVQDKDGKVIVKKPNLSCLFKVIEILELQPPKKMVEAIDNDEKLALAEFLGNLEEEVDKLKGKKAPKKIPYMPEEDDGSE